jgi:uncharacterized membrane protein/predicted DsbA family dithiol-disulfide isomerase
MRARLTTVGAIAAAAIGLAASAASLVDYLAPAPAFCADSGCATVRASAWSHPLGVPTPIAGIAFFAAMIALAMLARPRLRRALAIAGAAAAIGLIAVQGAVIGAWCKLCMVADSAALAHAAFVLAGAGAVARGRRGVAVAMAGLASTACGVALALGLGHSATAPALASAATPAWVTSAQRPGRVTVVELVDFECPFCRRMQERLVEAIGRTHRPVDVIRKMVPLRQHAGAMPAALAYTCAEAQGRGDAMAAALFAVEPAELTAAGCERIAARVGCDLDRYRATLRDPATQARIDADVAAARAAGVQALPTLFIGAARVTGAALSADELLAMIART